MMAEAVSCEGDSGPAQTAVTTKDDVPKTIRYEAGMARIKPEFVNYNFKRRVETQFLPKEAVTELEQENQLDVNEKGDAKEEKKEDVKENGKREMPAEGNEPPKKKFRTRGRFKKAKRPTDKRPDACDKLCNSVINGSVCQFGERCRFMHDPKAYMAKKSPNLGKKCYVYETYGHCSFGITCMYSDSHLDEDLKNMVNQEKYDADCTANSGVVNKVTKRLQSDLRKKNYDFKKANTITTQLRKQDEIQKKATKKVEEKPVIVPKDMDIEISAVSFAQEKINASNDRIAGIIDAIAPTDESSNDKEIEAPKMEEPEKANEVNGQNGCGASAKVESNGVEHINGSAAANGTTFEGTSQVSKDVEMDVGGSNVEGACAIEDQHLGVVTDEGLIKLRPQEKPKLEFRDKLYLAPLTTVGNLPFRRVCKSLGADITCSEMATCHQLLQGTQSEWALLKRHPCEDMFGIQLCGSFPDTMTRTAQLLNENCNMDFVDINCGCPIDVFFKRGEGCALMGRTNKLSQIVRGVTSVLDCPLTVKMRTGISEKVYTAHNLIPRLRDWGTALVTIHGRSREQRYTKLADWDYINTCAQKAAPMPLFGNGDILSFDDYSLHREQTGVAGCMIARGALMKPWVFTEIKEERHWDISSSERMDILRDFTNYGLEHWGSDKQGVANTRRFLLEWQSFLYRYIPCGVLETLPQRINEKAPYFNGRDELETLMASANCADWIKLSEMLLGPVPDNFSFLPKHKANAYG